jgi:predicted dehydrogenase
VRVALAGYGFAGKTLHAPLIRSVPGFELAAVMSSGPEKVLRDLPDVAVSPSPEEVLARPDIELAVIATPNDSHFPLARLALEAGKHVVIDKPVTATLAEALELERLAARAGRLLSVYHCRRWDSDFLTARAVIASGELLPITHFESRYDRYRPAVQDRWRERPGVATGIWYDLGSHLADQALQLFGPPESVCADLGAQRQGGQAVDYFHVLLRYGRLRVILRGANLVAEGDPRRFEIHGEAGSFIKYGMDTQEPALRRGERPGGEGWGDDPRPGTLTLRRGESCIESITPPVLGDYREYYRAIHAAIREGAPNPVTPAEAAAVMNVLETACRSSEERREIAFTRTPEGL